MERPSDEELERRIAEATLAKETRNSKELGMTIEEYRAWQNEREKEAIAKRAAEDEIYYGDQNQIALSGFDIPSRTLHCLNEPMQHTEAMAAISRKTDILVLSGGPGCGKSVAAAFWIVFNSITGKGGGLWAGGYWVTAASLSRGYAYDQEAFAKLTKKHALVIDDLGTEYQDQKERYLATLAEIVETRFAREKLTLITTNLGPAEFKARYGERLADRIREDGAFVECGTTSLRRKQVAQVYGG